MTFEENAALPKRFVTTALPWLVGLGALLVYLGSMNHSATFSSAGIVSRVSGWDWHGNLQQPLLFIALYPFRFLPQTVIPLALNVFNAVLGSLVLVLLARTVALLPHDRTPDQRELVEDEHGLLSVRTAWIPPVFAALVLGLQISFWENATAVTGEMIDVAVVAYVIRCLLEFRIDGQQSWLSRAAFLYAAGMANNWALIGLSPVFLATILWLKGLAFFNLRFLARMTLWGLAGLLLYLLLPWVQCRDSITPVPFWDGLVFNLKTEWKLLGVVKFLFKEDYKVLALAASSLLPLFAFALRWRSSYGDNSPLGILIAKGLMHLMHAVLLAFCLWVSFSSPLSPRALIYPRTEWPFLNHSYLSAIAIGYCAGYFLLICAPAFRSRRRMNGLLRLIGRATFFGILTLAVLMPVALVSRNLNIVRLTNGRLVEDFVDRLQKELPAAPCAIASDSPTQLALLQTKLQQTGQAKDYVFYDTHSGTLSDYHAFQKRRQPAVWPERFASITNHAEIRPVGLLMFVRDLLAKGPVYYLQPTFGYYLELCELTPKGLTYLLTAYPTNRLLEAPLSAEVIRSNEAFWTDFDANILPALKRCLPAQEHTGKALWAAQLMDRLHLSDERSLAAEALAAHYSRVSTYWAVQLQQLGKWDEATNHLARALVLNPENLSAQVTLEFNQSRRKDASASGAAGLTLADRFGKRDWDQVMSVCGPFDEPEATFAQALTFARGGLNRQAFQYCHRVVELEPTNFVASICLADLYTLLGQPKEALLVTQNIRTNAKTFAMDPLRELELARVEATALLRLGDKEKARAILGKALAMPEAGSPFRAQATQLYLQAGMNADALPLLDRLIADNPTDPGPLANRGYALLQTGQFEAAKESLTKALELAPKNGIVRLNRAVTLLRAKEYDAAREDYEVLLKDYPQAYQVHYGLGELAAAKNDSAGAISHFEICLKAAPAGTPDYLQVSNRLAEVRAQRK
jgi:tetratricopeptide (TPR) repeat protein